MTLNRILDSYKGSAVELYEELNCLESTLNNLVGHQPMAKPVGSGSDSSSIATPKPCNYHDDLGETSERIYTQIIRLRMLRHHLETCIKGENAGEDRAARAV